MSAAALYEQGYTGLVRVAPRNKRPVMAGWQTLPVTLDMAREWDTAGANVGMRGEDFPAVDIDLGTNAALAEEVVRHAAKMLGGAPKRFSPKAGSRLLVYRTNDPFLKMRLTLPDNLGAIEILGAGRQYLVEGIHPDGGPYHWNRTDLKDITPARLTEVTADKMLAFLEHLRQEYGGRVNVVKHNIAADDVVAPEDLAAPSLEALETLLSAFPNNDAFLKQAFPNAGDERDTWVAFGHAVKGAGGSAAAPAFLEWTNRYEDGVADPALAEDAFHGFQPHLLGWAQLERIHRTLVQTPDEVFDILEGEEPAIEERVGGAPTDEDIINQILPSMLKRVAFVAGGWYMWDGAKWADDADGHGSQLIIRDKLRAISSEMIAQAEGMGKEGVAMLNCARRYQNRGGIESVVSLLKACVAKDMDAFDRDLMSLNTPAGLVDLNDGSSRLAEPSDMVSRSTAAAIPAGSFDPLDAPNWTQFLDHLTDGDTEYRTFLQRYMGYSLTGHMDEKKFAFVWGSNSNTGKSTFVNAVQYALGDYARAVDVDMFMGGNKGNSDDLAQLPGVRLVTATEPSAGQKWDDKLVKAVTGGDVVSARRLYKSHFTFKPQFKILIAGNHEPELKSVDTALLKRIMITPMNRVVEAPDFNLGRKLEGEAAHILRWMLDGCLEWQRIGLSVPVNVQVASDNYAATEDTMTEFLEETCVVGDEEDFTSTTDLFSAWVQWCNRNNASVGTKKQFKRDVISHGRLREVKRKSRGFMPVRLRQVEVFG